MQMVHEFLKKKILFDFPRPFPASLSFVWDGKRSVDLRSVLIKDSHREGTGTPWNTTSQ